MPVAKPELEFSLDCFDRFEKRMTRKMSLMAVFRIVAILAGFAALLQLMGVA